MTTPSRPSYQDILRTLLPAGASDVEYRLRQFTSYLLKINQRVNLVSRRDSALVVDDLIADSLAVLKLIDYANSAKLLDIGSGAGFPWIVHKIVRPDLQIVSVDSNQRKIEFQRAASSLLEFASCEFHAARIESLPSLSADYCIAKAFGTVDLICKLSAPHLKQSSRLLLPRSAEEILDPAGIHDLGFEIESETLYEVGPRLAKLLILTRR